LGLSRDSRPEPTDLAALFREHADGLAGAVRGVLGARADVAEVLQEAFLRCWRARDRGDRPADATAWVFVVTLNLAKDLRRAAARRGPAAPLEDAAVIASPDPSPAARLAGREAVDAARDAIAALDDDKKEVFLMRVSAGLSFEAAADALGIPVGTAKSRMRAALASLRETLASHAPTIEVERDAR
jgi:RNA polymerase sigma-70 factor (ECF subfamily)